jgi:hypothetical protein
VAEALLPELPDELLPEDLLPDVLSADVLSADVLLPVELLAGLAATLLACRPW